MTPEMIVSRYSRAIALVETSAVELIHSALDLGYRQLEDKLKAKYAAIALGGGISVNVLRAGQAPELNSGGTLAALQQQIRQLEELKALLVLLNPQIQSQLQESLRSIASTAESLGIDLGKELSGFSGTYALPIESAIASAQSVSQYLLAESLDFQNKSKALVTQGIIQGMSTVQVARGLRSQLAVSKTKAETIARTEILRASNSGATFVYQQNGIEAVQLIATSDERTCRICTSRNLNAYRMGAISLPLHPRCRCFLMPYQPDWRDKGLIDGEWEKEYYYDLLGDTQVSYDPSPWEKSLGLPAPKPIWQVR